MLTFDLSLLCGSADASLKTQPQSALYVRGAPANQRREHARSAELQLLPVTMEVRNPHVLELAYYKWNV